MLYCIQHIFKKTVEAIGKSDFLSHLFSDLGLHSLDNSSRNLYTIGIDNFAYIYCYGSSKTENMYFNRLRKNPPNCLGQICARYIQNKISRVLSAANARHHCASLHLVSPTQSTQNGCASDFAFESLVKCQEYDFPKFPNTEPFAFSQGLWGKG